MYRNRMDVAHATSVGLVRARQEDRYTTNGSVCAVADGMGGLAHGDYAATAVISAIEAIPACETTAQARSAIIEAVKIAHTMISHKARGFRRTSKPASGSTLAGFFYGSGTARPAWLVFNCGDSRVYEYDGHLHQISTDHSLVQDMIASGAITADQARLHPKRHIVTRAIGTACPADVDFTIRADRGQILLAVSDGVSDELTDDDIEDVLRATLAESGDLTAVADALVAAALEAGGHDNTTVVLARRAEGDTMGDGKERDDSLN